MSPLPVGILVALCLLLATVMVSPVLAADAGRTITLGESNTTAQRDELLAFFEAGDDDRISDVTLADTQRAMEGIIDVSDITSAYSSTALTCGAVGTGLEVETRNIEVVPPALYAMALATAGIDDATLVVAAPDDAPAEGMTALTGVFQTWDLAPCGGASLDPDRQALALEELALAMRIGADLGDDSGAQDAADLLLAIQQTIIVDDPKGRVGIVAAIETQEEATGITVPDAERDDLVDLMARLASQRIDWGSFDQGWRLTRGDDADRVTLRALAVDEPGDASAAAPTATPAPTPSATATPATGAFTGTGTAATPTAPSSGNGLPLGMLGLGLLALGLVGGLLLLLRRRRSARPVISFTPKTRPTVVSAVRRQVVDQTTRVEKTSWYRPRHRPGHSDGSAD